MAQHHLPVSRRSRWIHLVWITALVFVVARPDGAGASKIKRMQTASGAMPVYVATR